MMHVTIWGQSFILGEYDLGANVIYEEMACGECFETTNGTAPTISDYLACAARFSSKHDPVGTRMTIDRFAEHGLGFTAFGYFVHAAQLGLHHSVPVLETC